MRFLDDKLPPGVAQITRFGMIGVLNTSIYWAVSNLLIHSGVHTVPAAAVGFLASSVNSFWMNKSFTFRDRERHAVIRKYLIFLFFTLIGLAINTFGVWILHRMLSDWGTAGRQISLLGAIPFTFAWNFFTNRRWTFARPPTSVAS